MKIVILNGNTRHGSTWNCVNLFKEELLRYSETEVIEYSLPKDMPHFCNGCFSCFLNGEQTCPHANFVTPIVKSILEADLLILTSPVYAMDVSGQMKALLDHLCFMWMSHRPNPLMFSKIGLIVTTTAGAGHSHAAKCLNNSLKFWGVKRIFTFKKAVSAMKWSDVSDKKQNKFRNEISAMSKKIVKAHNNINKLSAPIFTKIFFNLMKGMMSKNTWNLRDKNHWQSNGWLDGAKPF